MLRAPVQEKKTKTENGVQYFDLREVLHCWDLWCVQARWSRRLQLPDIQWMGKDIASENWNDMPYGLWEVGGWSVEKTQKAPPALQSWWGAKYLLLQPLHKVSTRDKGCQGGRTLHLPSLIALSLTDPADIICEQPVMHKSYIESITISKNLPFHFVKQFQSESAKGRTASSPNFIFELILKNSFGGGKVTASDFALTQFWLFAKNVFASGRILSTNWGLWLAPSSQNKNIATGETSPAITPYHFFGNFITR